MFPTAVPAVAPGSSVRPPPISIKSLSEAAVRTSLPSVTGISSGGFAPPMAALASETWEPEAPTSPALQSLREADFFGDEERFVKAASGVPTMSTPRTNWSGRPSA